VSAGAPSPRAGAAGAAHERSAQATLYVIPGSHSCRAGILLLEHKRIAFRLVELPTGMHPLIVRTRGFPGHRVPIREVDGASHRTLALLDRMGTVPALRFGSERVQTNREISRFLDRVQPQPPLFPADAERRRAVEEAELWGDQVLQMAARRITMIGAEHGLETLWERGSRGRLDALLSRSEPMRLLVTRFSARFFFGANTQVERQLLDALPAMLEQVDAWIEAGVLGGEELNAADFMIAPSLALLAYRLDLRAEIEARPAGALLERVLPEPVASAS
jgi:glutathione S-transferase